MEPDAVFDVEEVIDDGKAPGARGMEHHRADEDAMPVDDLLERIGGAADGVALVVSDAALLGIADIRRGRCGGGRRR